MSDISIIDEELAWMIVAVLLSAGIFFVIFLYHVILAYIKSNRENIKCKDTRSYGYIVGGGVIIGFEFVCLLFLETQSEIIRNIATGVFSVILFFSPIMIWMIGSYYNTSKKL